MARSRLFIFLLLVGSSLHAQQTTGAVRGAVTDPSGAVVANVMVTATNRQTQVSQSTRTSTGGNYALAFLPPGSYDLSAEGQGFKKAVRQNVVVRITETELVDFILQLGSLSESITVGESISLVQSESSAEGRVI